MGEIIGYRILRETTTFDIPQEYAGASMEVEVPAGEYPIYLVREGSRARLTCPMPGIVVSDFFWNRIGAHGTAVKDKHVGKPYTYYWTPYSFILAEAAARGNVSLADGYYYTAEMVVSEWPHSVRCKEYADDRRTLIDVWRTRPQRWRTHHKLYGSDGRRILA